MKKDNYCKKNAIFAPKNILIMKCFVKALFSLVVLSIVLGSCTQDDDTRTQDDDTSTLGFEDVTWEEWPNTDCSTSTSPLRDILAYKLLGIPYYWYINPINGGTYKIYAYLNPKELSGYHLDFRSKNQCNGTHGAYMNLLKGETDLIIASRDISRNEKDSAAALGVELITTPLATDALVFIVNPKNPVNNLTTEQLQKIYTGEITNWKEVGGVDHAITPFIRDADSGSQEKMETMVMKGLTMLDESSAWVMKGSSMFSPYSCIAHDEYAIGYSPYFYCTSMVRDLIEVKLISIDGIKPNKKTLKGNSYPFTSYIYAAVRKSEPHESMAYRLFQFLFTKEGAKIVNESGYIDINK